MTYDNFANFSDGGKEKVSFVGEWSIGEEEFEVQFQALIGDIHVERDSMCNSPEITIFPIVNRDLSFAKILDKNNNEKEVDKMREQIENNFKYHVPKEDQIDRYANLRDVAKILAVTINDYCPNSREKSLAMTKLEEAVMWANASIARNEGGGNHD